MVEIIEAILASPVVRAFIEGICAKVVIDVLNRRSADPDFLAKSDAAFAAITAAKTPEELISAQKSLSDLMSSG